MTVPAVSPEATAATHEAVRLLVARDDLGSDATFLGSAAGREELTPQQAFLLRRFLVRHADRIPADILAAALSDEMPPPPPVRRSPGRPRLGAIALSPVERSRRRRAAASMVAVELPADVAARLRSVRDARDVTMAEVVEAALDALEAASRRSQPVNKRRSSAIRATAEVQSPKAVCR